MTAAQPNGNQHRIEPDSPPRYFGDYEILREAGRGGMGVVYEARQFGTQRVVALKLLSAGAFASSDAVHRFHTEAQAAARLEHPHIVPVFEAGMHDGQYFLAMRFLPGGTLAQLARGRPIDARRAASIVLSLARATAYAHQHGVLHRDLKPGNVLLDENGQAHLADFGLARLAELEGITLTSAILGTAAYLPPEQACGGAGAATTAGDIYGLGTVLYELLTGQPPFTGASVAEILRKVQEEEPAPLSRKSEIRNIRNLKSEIEPTNSPSSPVARPSTLDRDLQTICLKCLEKEPSKRYATAQDLADDLERFLNDEPILARPVTRIERLGRWCRRKPALATSIFLILILLVIVIIGSPIAAYRINEARQEEAAARTRAVAEAANARSILGFLRDDLLVLADPYRLAESELAPDRQILLITAIQRAADRIGSRFENQPRVEAEIRLTIGRALSRLDRLEESKEHLNRARALYTQTDGDHSPAALEVDHELGLLLLKQGNHEEASALQRRVLRERRQVLGDDHPAVFESLNALAASVGSDARNFDEATALHQEVLERGSRILGEDHSAVLEAMSALGRIAYELGQWDASYRTDEELARLVERKYGANDPVTLRLLARRIYDLRRIPGRFKESERLRLEAIERCRRVLGPDHRTTVFLLVDQGYSDQDKGRWGSAIKGRREILDLVRTRFGDRHLETLFAEDMLGGTLRAFGDFQEAEAIHRLSVPVRQALSQKATIEEHRSLRYLVWSLFHQGKLEEAEQLQKQVVSGLIEAHGNRMQRVFLGTEKVVKFLGVQGKWQEIAAIYKARAPLDTERHSIWPFGLIHLPAGVVAASLTGDEQAIRIFSDLMVDRFQDVTDPNAAAEVALACLTVEKNLLTRPQDELLQRMVLLVEPTMGTSARAYLVGGLASLRAGNPPQVIERLGLLLNNPDTTVSSCAGFATALAHHQMGNTDAALRALKEANARLSVALQSGQLGHKGQDDWDYSVRWAEYGRSLALQQQAELAILGRHESPKVNEQFLKERRQEWASVQALLDEFEQWGRQRNWSRAKAALLQALDEGPINWDEEGNRVRDLIHKAAMVFAITGERESYERLVNEVASSALADQPYYNLPLAGRFAAQPGFIERIAENCRKRSLQEKDIAIWDRIRWGEAEYRLGNHEAALSALEPALSHHRLEASGIAHAYSALAAQALQRTEQANQFLKTARSKYEQLLADNPERLAQDWHQFARLDYLFKEAATLVVPTESLRTKADD
jgi:serine/threonine protein kinase